MSFSIISMRKGRQIYQSKTVLSRRIKNGSLVTYIWGITKKNGLIINLNTGEIHCIINILCVVLITFILTELIEICISKKDPLYMIECISILGFFIMAVCKLFNLRSYGKQWGSLLKQTAKIENAERKEENTLLDIESDNENDISVSTFIESYTKSFRSRYMLLIKFYSLMATLYIISPFIEYALKKYRNQNIVKYPHFLPIWTPLDEVSVYGYLLTIILEIIAGVYAISVHIVFDTAALGLMMFIQSQFYLLHAKSERIAGNGKEYKFSKTTDNRAHMRIKHCHRIHVALITLAKQFNQLTKNIFGLYFLVATTIFCSVAIQLKTELTTVHLVHAVQYMSVTLVQLFSMCYYGDAVLNESAVDAGRGPLSSAWWCLSPRIRKELILLHIGMSIQYQLNAGIFFYLSLPSFIQILRTAYSCYAVFKQV